MSINLIIGTAIGSATTGGVDPLLFLRPLSYIKAIPNEYNSGAGLGSGVGKVGITYHGVAYEDVGTNALEIWFPNYAATAGQGEWSTNGTLGGAASMLFTDVNGTNQIATFVAGATANPFQDFKLRQTGVRPKAGSHFWINAKLDFSTSGYYSHGRADYANGDGLVYSTTSVTNLVGSSTLYGNTYSGAGDFYGPSFVGGVLSRPTYALSGDSNNSGVLSSGTISDTADTLQGGIGAINRLLLPNMAGIDISIPGATASEMADPTKTVCRDRLMRIGGASTKRFYALGTNDILFNSQTSAQVKTDVETAMARHGVGEPDAFIATITPVTTSQATNTVPNAGKEAIKQTENTRRRARTNVVDVAVGVESGTTGVWQSTTYEIDGTHLSTAGNKVAVTGANFNVATKTGAAAVNAGYKFATGALYQSLDFSSGWTGQQASIDAVNKVYAPEHKVTARILTEDSTASSAHDIFSQQTLALASTTKTISCFVKRLTGTPNVQLQVQQNGGSFLSSRVWGNLGTGAVTLVEQAAGTVSGMTSVAFDDYYQVFFTVAFGSGHPASSFIYVKMANASGSDTYNGNGTSSLAIWGFDIR